jgi:hypothetical protein
MQRLRVVHVAREGVAGWERAGPEIDVAAAVVAETNTDVVLLAAVQDDSAGEGGVEAQGIAVGVVRERLVDSDIPITAAWKD